MTITIADATNLTMLLYIAKHKLEILQVGTPEYQGLLKTIKDVESLVKRHKIKIEEPRIPAWY